MAQHIECGPEGPSEDEIQLDTSLDETEEASKCLTPKRNFEEIPEGQCTGMYIINFKKRKKRGGIFGQKE